MTGLRVTSEFWVSALRKSLDSYGIPIFVIQRGDKRAGAIIIRISDLRGRSKVFTQAPSMDGVRQWVELANGPDTEIEKVLQKQKEFDGDVWIIEVEEFTGFDFANKFLFLSGEN